MQDSKATFTNIAMDVVPPEDGDSQIDFSGAQEPAPKKLSEGELTSAAKLRLKTWEFLVIGIFVIPGLFLLFSLWPLGIIFIAMGLYFRYLAIEDHKNAILFETGDPGAKLSDVRSAKPMTTARRVWFWMAVGWLALGIYKLMFSIYPGMPADEVLMIFIVCLTLFFFPAYFVCRKAAPRYTLSMLFSAKARDEIEANEQRELQLAIQQKEEKQAKDDADTIRRVIEAEQRKVDAELKAKVRAEERENERVLKLERDAETESRKRLQEDFLNSVQAKCSHNPVVATVLGGSGLPLTPQEVVWVSCRSDSVALSRIARQEDYTIPYSILVKAEVTGPGTETSSANIIGGGFGLEGAAKGILIATVLNALTSSTKTNTFLRLSTNSGEVHFRVTTLEPEQLRLVLSPLFVKVESRHARVATNSSGSSGLASELEKLGRLRSDGLLSDEEFAAAKKKLLAG